MSKDACWSTVEGVRCYKTLGPAAHCAPIMERSGAAERITDPEQPAAQRQASMEEPQRPAFAGVTEAHIESRSIQG